MANLEPLMRRNFLEYASYTILDRSLPDLRDGCKPVQRRILHTLFTMDDGLFNKVANVIGDHEAAPHGTADGDALCSLRTRTTSSSARATSGNRSRVTSAAASRLHRVLAHALARDTLFNRT
jgi:topoisomerase-4 subunit A